MTTAAAPLVRFAGVSKSYDGETLVVRDLDLEIRRGEFLTLLGPSGSGKTTTLMMLSGFEAPTAGQITLSGRDITTTPPYRRGIGMVFQNYALFPHMTVGENIAYPLKLRRLDAATIAIKERDLANKGEELGQVVAAYNAQVLRIRRQLELAGIQDLQVGTVDKFQGKQAPVVFFSLAVSSADDVPRGISFLLSRNRVNVAISRAKYATYIVRSSRLTDYLPASPAGLIELGAVMGVTETI